MPPLPLPVSPRGTGGDWRTYRNALISVHPSRQFLSRSIPEAELSVSEGVFRTPDFGLRTRRWMSANSHKRTSSGASEVQNRVYGTPP